MSNINISTTIGNTYLPLCIYNASGCNCTTGEELDILFDSDAGAVLSKSSTIRARVGNPEPRFMATNIGSINSMGIPNHGHTFYADYYDNKIKKKEEEKKSGMDKNFIQSLYPFSVDDLETMLLYVHDKGIKNVEVNISCPNLLGNNNNNNKTNYENITKYLDYIKIYKISNPENMTIGIKLQPYFHSYEFDTVADILLKHDCIDYITTINSINNGLLVNVDAETTLIKPNNGYGGIGGNYVLPTTLANINNFYKRLGDKINIIGSGGVTNGSDVFAHILCGATAVQVGTQFCKEGPTVFTRLSAELTDIMFKKGYTCLDDFRGNLKVIR